jgi:hypothetical protein
MKQWARRIGLAGHDVATDHPGFPESALSVFFV